MHSRIAALAIVCLFASLPAIAAEPVRGFVKAIDDATITTELNARVKSMAFREGARFRRGDVLIAFDCAKYEADLRAAEAEERFNKLTLDNSIELDKRKAIGMFEVHQNRARLDKAKAATEGLAVRVAECVVRAPFDGRMGETRIYEHETSTPNQPLFRIVDTERLEIEMIVPSTWLVWLKPEQDFTVRVDETGRDYRAQVARIAAAVDPVSQTVKITATFRDGNAGILPGMSLSATFPPPAH